MSGDIQLPEPGTSPFDVIKHLTPDGIEYWEARELLTFMGYIN